MWNRHRSVPLGRDIELTGIHPVECYECLIMCIMSDDGNVTLNIYRSVTVVYTV